MALSLPLFQNIPVSGQMRVMVRVHTSTWRSTEERLHVSIMTSIRGLLIANQ